MKNYVCIERNRQDTVNNSRHNIEEKALVGNEKKTCYNDLSCGAFSFSALFVVPSFSDHLLLAGAL